ncbi:hypothetical protein EG68_02210, partial [Paragonimus skrjabini miyazakii]
CLQFSDFRSSSEQPSPTHLNNLGWVIHLIRWLLAEHYVTAWDWHQVLVIVDAVLPTLLVYLAEQRTMISKLPLPENVDPDRSASLSFKQYRPGYSQLLHDIWSVERTFCENTLVPLLSCVLAESSDDPDDLNASYTYSGVYHVPLNLFHGSSYFIVEPTPALYRFPCSDSSMLAMEDVDTFEELFCLLRWLLVFVHQHSGSTLNVTLSQGSVITCLRYLFQKWNSIADRISFQNDTTCWKQVRSMRNFFGVFAALLLTIQDDVLLADPTEAKSAKELLVELMCTISSGPDDVLRTKRQRIENETSAIHPVSDDAIWSHLLRLINTANHGNYLWWCVLDWAIRLKWQQVKSTGFSISTTLSSLEQIFEKLPACAMMARTPVAYECMLIALHTCSTVLRYELTERSTTQWKLSTGALIGLHYCWTTALRTAELTTYLYDPERMRRRGGSVSKSRLQNQDHLAYELLLELVYLLTLSPGGPFISLRVPFSNQLDVYFRKIFADRTVFFTESCWWRLRFFIVIGSVFPELQFAQYSNAQHVTPAAITYIPVLHYFVQQCLNPSVPDPPVDEETIYESNRSTISSYCSLVGLYSVLLHTFACSSNQQEFVPNSTSLCVSDSSLFPGTALSTLQIMEIIDYICEMLSNHPLLFHLEEAITDSDSLRALIQLFFLWLQLAHLRSHLRSSKDHAVILPQLPIQPIKTVLSGLILDLLKIEGASSDSLESKRRIRMLNEKHRVECSESTKRDELTLCSLEALLDCLPVQTTNDTWLSVTHFEQLVERATAELSRRPLISDLLLPKTGSTPGPQKINDACNSSRFGDDDFDDCRSVAADQLEQLPEEVDGDNLLKRAHSRRTINLRLFSVLFYFALRIRSCSMLDSLQASLTQLLCNSPCHNVESMEWLCCLVSTTAHAVSEVVRCPLRPFNPDMLFEGLVASFLSCLVDAVREALKARVTRVGCLSHVCQLIRAAVQLIYCVVTITNEWTKQQQNCLADLQRWQTIGQHLNQLICAVWSIVAKRGVRLLRGFPLVPADCLQAWMQLHAAGILDTAGSPDHLLSVVLQPHSTPAVLLQFLQFLEKLNDKCRSIVWTRQHSSTLRTLLNSLLRSLKNKQVALQQIVWPGRNSDKFTDLDVTIYVYRLIHSLLIQLSSTGPSYAVNSMKRPEGQLLSLRPELNCLIQSCMQLADLHSYTREAQCEKVFEVLIELSPGRDLSVFEQHIRPYLLPLVISTWFQDNSDGPNLEAILKRFPWRCFGLADYSAACKHMQAELIGLALTHIWSPKQSMEFVQLVSVNREQIFYDLVAVVSFERFCSDKTSNFDDPWDLLLEIAGGLQVLQSATHSDVFLSSIVEHILRMLALRETTDRVSTDSALQSLTALSQQLLLCLVHIAKLLKLATPDFSPLTFFYDVQMVCSLVSSDSDLSSVVEHLLELAARLAPVSVSSAGNIQGDILLPRRVRYSCWIAVSTLVTILLYHPSSSYSQKNCHSGLKNFAFWRLVVGHLELLSIELSSSYSIVSELLSSLDLLFVNYVRTHTGPDRDVQMEIALHHATVYHLSAVVINLFRPASDGCLPFDDQNLDKEVLLAKVSAILDVLLDPKETSVQFQMAVCQLPNFPTELAHVPPDACAFFAKYQQSVRKLCTCGRENLLQEMKLYCSSLNSSRLLRCPQLARYQCWILDHLNEQLLNWISLNASDVTIDFELDQFQCMVVSPPDELRQACEKICLQLNTNPEDFLASLSSMAEMLVELLSPSGVGSFRDKTDHNLLDHPTQKAGFRCLSSVQRLVAHFRLVMYNVLSPTNSAFKESYSVESVDSSDLDPSVSRMWKCILGTAHLASPTAPVACRVLRQLFTNCGPSLDSLIPEPDGMATTSLLSTLFCPYVQARQLKRRTDTQHTDRLSSLCEQLSRMSEPELVQCITKRLEQFITTCPASEHVYVASRDWLSSFTLWLLDVNPAYNEIYMYIKPLFPLSFELSKHLFPWLVVHTLQSTFASLPHILSTCISACLSQPSTSPLIQHLWIDSLLAYHAWEQWRRVQCPRLPQPLKFVSVWLSAAERALDLMRPLEARLFLELAWLADDCPTAWLTRQLRTRRIWLGVCRQFNDLAGLRAAQAAFLFPCTSALSPSLSFNVVDGEENSSFPQDLHPMLNETNVIVHEMFGNWNQLLAWHDRSFPLSSTPLTPDMALCLQRMRAHNLLQRLLSSQQPWSIECSEMHSDLSVSDTSRNHNSRLEELRAATAWRLGQWDTQNPRGLRHPPVPSTTFARIDYGTSSDSSFSRYGLETTLFWLVEAAQRHDWIHVARIASWKCTSLMSEVNTLTPIMRMDHQSLSNFSHQISWFTRISEIANRLTPNNFSTKPDTALRTGYLSLLNEAVSFIYLMALPGWSFVDGSASQNTAATLVESVEPFVTGTLRLASSLATQFTTTNLDEQLVARSHYLVTQCYLRAASAATDVCQFAVADDWLQNADQCQRVIARFLSDHSELKPGLYAYQAWLQLSSILSASCLQRLKREPRLAANHLQAGLAAAELTIGQLHQDTGPMTHRGLINFYVHSITVLCDWLFELRTKSAADLLTNYLEPAMKLSRHWSVEVGADALASLAQFADAQFVALDSYLSSSEFATRRQLLSDAQHDVTCLTDLGEKSRLLRLLQRQSAIEVEELDSLTSDADRYLETALDSFAQCLTVSDAHDLKIYRFISLWLSSAAEPLAQSNSDTRKRNINRLMSERVPCIRADKFLPLTPQLAVRLSLNRCGSDQDFQSTLFELVVRIVDWHPHHAAFTLLFLVNAELDNLYDPKTAIAQHPAVLPLRSRQTRLTSGSRKLSNSENPQSLTDQNQRIQAARRVLTWLMEGRRGPLLRQMQSLAEAYVELANADVDKHRGSTANIPFPSGCKVQHFAISTRLRGLPVNRNGELNLVAVPTATPLIDRSGQYPSSGVVFISGFAPTFRLAGGINLPKIVTCLGTDGNSYRQIIKGRDDPRQDAVMQQVFSAANCLLARRRYQSTSTSASVDSSSDTAVRHCSWLNADGGLRMLTYKVIPMAQRSGVIEWCEGTIPLGEWLAADHTGAHQRYRPKDMSPGQAKQRLAAVRDRPPERRCAVFGEICEKLSPVLAYFYLEHFPEPHSWCRARSSYTRSLAVSSLIGYLVGLGDRHPHNLLLNRTSGELVHIDLGVAFDQGRLLPTPEMVPFRLTRDLVHALGPLGLEAGFKPAAETVLSELRIGGDVICTLLQVLLYDPLYSWSLTPAQLCALEARRAECPFGLMRSKPSASVLMDQTNFLVERDVNADPSGTVPIDQRSALDVPIRQTIGPRSKLSNTTARDPVNQLAERVLLNVRSKLAGRVTGTLAAASSEQRKCGGLNQLDVAGHVGLLMHAATDRSNLARMYFGWQAYL